jgi:hypothetical protein
MGFLIGFACFLILFSHRKQCYVDLGYFAKLEAVVAYMSTRRVSEAYGFSESFLNKRRVFGGGPPFIKVGRKVLYDDAKFEAWLAAHERRSTSEQPTPVTLPPPAAPKRKAATSRARPRKTAAPVAPQQHP